MTEESAAQRRERLKALREAQELLTSESPQPQQETKTQPQEEEQDEYVSLAACIFSSF
jgi:hypothetical protein